ncbi:hypothetical protein D3C74_91360 [compost metagenome]
MKSKEMKRRLKRTGEWIQENKLVIIGIIFLIVLIVYMKHGKIAVNPTMPLMNQIAADGIQYVLWYWLFVLGVLFTLSPLGAKEKPPLTFKILVNVLILPVGILNYVIRKLDMAIYVSISVAASILLSITISVLLYVGVMYIGTQFNVSSIEIPQNGIYYMISILFGFIHVYMTRWIVVIGSQYIIPGEKKIISKKKALYITLLLTGLFAFLLHSYTVVIPDTPINGMLDTMQDGFTWFASLYALYEIMKDKLLKTESEETPK